MASQPSDIGKVPEGKDNATSMRTGKKATAEDDVEDFPDPDEDDLDDLDDFLPTFSAKAESKKPEQPTQPADPVSVLTAEGSGSEPKLPAVDGEDESLNEEFAKELEKGMASFFTELESSPDMKAQFEDMFKKIAEAAAEAEEEEESPSQSSANKSKSATEPPGANFQDTILRTMERMKSSGDRTTEELSKEGEKGLLGDLMSMLGKANLDGEAGEEDINSVLLGMMEHLTNKDILYEPMKELHDQFPLWLEKNKDKVSPDDKTRYEQQTTIVSEIVARFESGSYSDSNPDDRQYIIDRMQKMQEAGSPPPDLLETLPSAQDATNPDVFNDEACNPQ